MIAPKVATKARRLIFPYETHCTSWSFGRFVELFEVGELMFSLLEEDPFELVDTLSFEENQVDPAQRHQYGDYRWGFDLPRKVPVVQFGAVQYGEKGYNRSKEKNARECSNELRPPFEHHVILAAHADECPSSDSLNRTRQNRRNRAQACCNVVRPST